MNLRFSVIILLIVFSLTAAAGDADTKASLVTALDLWEPISVTVKGGTATIRAKESRMTEQIYLAMVGGVCIQTLAEPGSLEQLTQIEFLNRHGAIGYVFEGGAKECREYVKLPVSKAKIWVLARTHLK